MNAIGNNNNLGPSMGSKYKQLLPEACFFKATSINKLYKTQDTLEEQEHVIETLSCNTSPLPYSIKSACSEGN